ncbi:MAG: M67 family metallopeptidase [Tepidisphaeraceae bacterium]
MSDPSQLILSASQVRQIEREAAAAYPQECCGAILGKERIDGGRKRRIVQRLEALKNSFSPDERYRRFSLDPLELMQLEKRASHGGLSVLGFYHSHPDHPSRPSEYDRQHAWGFYSYVIVAVAGGEAAELTSWRLDEKTGTFEQEDVLQERIMP